MTETKHQSLSRRERQIMDAVYRRGRAGVGEILEDLADAPSYSAVRALVRILEEKGHLRHESEGNRYVYLPTLSRAKASRSALRGLVDTFFGGSPEQAMAALIDVSREDLSQDDLERLATLIESARQEGR